ncbi:hypothetical protein N7539_008207 [Penicillium diatomitis]|uniref:Uncharacterized protein n=1 Tax=Penicillium diatomitis TaxID=2819901 RepID=A0A9W9WTM1_9EURO|nr:uncharacterized protein N7539_008207 [Penicillium diatomitis]KAJ5475141.1 hypothetical protein N7539_008207 [Penicillium diatomitis]
MRIVTILLYALAWFFHLGNASKLATPAEMLAMYNAYALDFAKNGAQRTIGPALSGTEMANFGTFASRVYVNVRFPKKGIFLSSDPKFNRANVDEITKYLPRRPKYSVEQLLGKELTKMKMAHYQVLALVNDVVYRASSSSTSSITEKLGVYLPEYKYASAGIIGARQQEIFSQGLQKLFQNEFSKAKLESEKIKVPGTDLEYDYVSWKKTLASSGVPQADVVRWYSKDVWEKTTDNDVRLLRDHRVVTAAITWNLGSLDSVGSCTAFTKNFLPWYKSGTSQWCPRVFGC